MKRNRRWIFFVLCFLVPALMTGGQLAVPARAVTEGTAYVAKAAPYYKHPVTGQIEDPGNNEGIGQSMTESVLYKKALIEETADGKLYATVRIFLTDNINNIKIWTQKESGGTWKKASTRVMQENLGGEYCSDYRFEIPEKKAVMRMSFYVTPMGREVIFYFNFSNLKKGSGDFVTSVQTTKTASADRQKKKEKEEEEPDTVTVAETVGSSGENTNADITGKDTQKDVKDTENGDTDIPTGEELVEEADGLVLSDDSMLSGKNESGGGSDVQSGEEDHVKNVDKDISGEQEPLRVSWILVLQCILIITVPSILIILAHGSYLRYMKRNGYE